MKRALIFPLVATSLVLGCGEDPKPELPPPVVITMDMGDSGGSMIDMAPFMIPDVPETPECDMNAEDLPDRYGFDTNCDGIDGDAEQSVFVASYGDDSFSGTRYEPKRTIQAALELASMDPSKTWVLVQEGLYDGPLTLVDGVSIAGGYELGWARDGDGFSTVSGGNSVLKGTPTIRGTNIITPTYLMNLEVRPEEQIAPGESVYTIALLDSPAVIFERMFVIGGTAGNGLDGASGAPGDNGPNGGKGGDGREHSSGLVCSEKGQPPRGSGGVGSCGGGYGGDGGLSGVGDDSGTGGSKGEDSANGAPGGSAGGGGRKKTSGTAGGDGADGAGGEPGMGASPGGYFENFNWIAQSGSVGGVGSFGAGGGGGGGGGGGTDNCDSYGGSGGGGGAGGCGGGGGEGGQPGGASVAIFMKGSAGVEIHSTRIVIGQGGNGGRGGNGGPGGSGGSGGKGGKRDHDDGLGGNGGAGGKGGQGGTGGGGAGGPAFGIYSDAAMLVPPSEMTYIPGQGGFGGAGSGVIGKGASGESADLQVGSGAL